MDLGHPRKHWSTNGIALWFSTDIARSTIVNLVPCSSCGLPLPPGVRHASSAECAAALLAEVATLKNALLRRDQTARQIAINDTSSSVIAPLLGLRRAI